MNRLVHSRLLLVLLAVLLQVAMLPGQGRFRCMLRTGSLTSCCCAIEADTATMAMEVAPSEDTAPSCCHAVQPDPDEEGPETCVPEAVIPGIGGNCSCDSESTDLLVAPGIVRVGQGDEVRSDDDHESSAALAVRILRDPELRAAAKRAALRVIPRARTGPPLYILLQTFLI